MKPQTQPSKFDRAAVFLFVFVFGAAALASFLGSVYLLIIATIDYLHSGAWLPLSTLDIANMAIYQSGGNIFTAWNNWVGLQDILRSMPGFISAFVGSVVLWIISVGFASSS